MAVGALWGRGREHARQDKSPEAEEFRVLKPEAERAQGRILGNPPPQNYKVRGRHSMEGLYDWSSYIICRAQFTVKTQGPLSK